nr:signal recognition particle-docking protein FtsY [uncultured Ruminococcus sp.]
MGLFKKIKEGLKKTRDSVVSQIDSMLKSFTKIDEELFEELTELLVMGDVGIQTAEQITDELRVKVKKEGIKDPNEITKLLQEVVADMLRGDEELKITTNPSIILVIGVNGVGKTTTIGKLANNLKKQGKSVLLAAADTFRAAAIEQLEIWADRSGCDIVKQNEGSDPAAVIYDAISAAKARNTDVIICDTAGRLHNKKHLMDELAKIGRVIDRELPDADKEYLLVLDATTGQNAVNQAEQFSKATGITGIVLTKLDGTAKGGVVLAIKNGLGIPVKYIGVGEQIDDLQEFVPEDFAKALFDFGDKE